MNNRKKNSVLFVDDEINILKAIKRGLYKEDYNMFFASSGKEALDILEKEDISVVVSDMKMPVMTGLELLKIVKEKYPNIVKIILSGYTHLPQILVTINQVDIFKFITKPWDIEGEFKKIIKEAIDYYNLHEENENLRESLVKKNDLYQKLIKSSDHRITFLKKFLNLNSEISKIILEDIEKSLINLKTKQDIDLVIERTNISREVLELSSSIKKMSSKEHNLDDLREELIKEFKSINDIYDEDGEKEFDDCKLKIVSKSFVNISLGEEFYIFLFVFKIIFLKLYRARFSDEFTLVFNVEKNENSDDVKVIILISSSLNKFIKEKKRLEYYIKLLGKYMEYFEGMIRYINKEGKHIIALDANLKRKGGV